MTRNSVTRGLRGEGENMEINPMHPKTIRLNSVPRCNARTRRGTACQCPAMPNGRCRMHGGKSSGAPRRNRNAYKNGRYTAKAIANRKKVADLIRLCRELDMA